MFSEFEKLREAEVILGDPTAVAKYLYKLPNLKWFQSTWAGIDDLMKCVEPGKIPSFITTKLYGVLGPAMVQYVLGSIISWERNFREMLADQKEHKWYEDEFSTLLPFYCHVPLFK